MWLLGRLLRLLHLLLQVRLSCLLSSSLGLFPGPSLISFPVPATQIGSIQMPLHLHPQVGPSPTHIHPSQPHLFQFSQLRYTSPISQGILPLAPPSMSFVQLNVPAHFTTNQNPEGSIPVQAIQNTKIDIVSLPMDSQLGLVPRSLDLPQDNTLKEVKSLPLRVSADDNVMTSHAQSDISHIVENSSRYELGLQVTDQGHHETVKKNYVSLSNARGSKSLPQNGSTSSQSFSRERDLSGWNSMEIEQERNDCGGDGCSGGRGCCSGDTGC